MEHVGKGFDNEEGLQNKAFNKKCTKHCMHQIWETLYKALYASNMRKER